MIIDAYKALGFQRVTGLSSSTALTVPAGTCLCMIQAESQSVRWRDDRVAPTAAIGYILAAGSELLYTGNPELLRFFETAASATLNVCYYGN